MSVLRFGGDKIIGNLVTAAVTTVGAAKAVVLAPVILSVAAGGLIVFGVKKAIESASSENGKKKN